MKILHIYPTDIYSQNRLFKEARYVLTNGIADAVYAVGLWVGGREEAEIHPSGLRIIRIKTKIRELFSKNYRFRLVLIRKILALYAYFQYFRGCYSAIRQTEPDVLTCHYVTDLPIACFFGWIRDCPVVYLPHELETERSGLAGFAKYRDKLYEYLFIQYVKDVVVVCEPIALWYRDRYKLRNVHVVRNAPEIEAAKVKPTPANFRKKFDIPEQSIIFIYQGMFGVGRGTEELLDAFSYSNNDAAHLVMMGFGSSEAESLVMSAAEKWVNIHYHEAVPLNFITSYSAGADIGIIVSEGTSLSYELSQPNKFFEYIHAGLPILVSDNLKYLAKLVSDNLLGLVVDLRNLKDVFSRLDIEEINSFKIGVAEYAKSTYWENDAVIFAKVYR